MTRLSAGEKPPQFILFSFDGVGVSENWDLFLETAEQSDARFSALMTGLYFLTDDNKHEYQGPRHAPGESSLAFGGTRVEVIEQIEYLNRTWYGGHEMGTHYVGHFCAGTRYPGRDWSTEDWDHELTQFFRLMTDWRELNNIRTGPDLAFGPEVVKGGRTQCLEGGMGELFPALGRHNMTWDSSKAAQKAGVYWPTKVGSIWEFPVPYVWSPPLQAQQTALDYNFWVSVNGGHDRRADSARIAKVVTGTYDYMFTRAFEGNRAPLVIANHLNDWNGNAFNPPTVRFMADKCAMAEVVCATYQDVIAWMELQDPAVLQQWTSRAPVAVDATR
ncbi:polysaccharide deacetylase [Williamsia sp.]|uniref:polysaccharide deacetylase n=1 Tax=Williamsia sp. TaxID=1872085 RepID=UPI002F95A319